jgi:hypothetical protein
MQGTHALQLAGDLVFIASAGKDELRVMDLSASPVDFVRAPNPLEPLSIPVLRQPEALGRDSGWSRGADGRWTEMAPRYVYAWSPGSAEISVVGAAREDGLKELRRLRLGQPITALAASAGASGSTLYVATWEGGASGGARGTLWTVALPSVAEVGAAAVAPRVIRTFAGERVEALAVLPGEEALVVARRAEDGAGDAFVLPVAQPEQEVSLRFPAPADAQVRADCEALVANRAADVGGRKGRGDCGFGAPVRALDVQPNVAGAADAVRVFGLLDESSCNGGAPCTGIEAVEFTRPGGTGPAVAPRIGRESYTGLPMLPLQPPTGFITSFRLAPATSVYVPALASRVRYDPLGLATSGSGELLFFDAEALRLIDNDASGPTFTLGALAADGGLLDGGGVSADSVVLGHGAARTETLAAIFSGPLAGTLPAPADSAQLELESGAANAVPGDEVVWVGAGEDCGEVGVVTSVSGTRVTLSAPPSAGCSDRTAYYVRAGAGTAEPFTVLGSVTGRMGRMAPAATFVYPPPGPTDEETASRREARYFFHGLDAFGALNDAGTYVPAPVPAPQVAFSLTGLPADLVAGDSYRLSILSHVLPLGFALAPQTYATNAYVPTSILHAPATDRVYVAYPAANSVLELDLETLSGARSWTVTGTYQ